MLFQHLFWFYSHPAVYIMILPAFGVVSELIAAFTRRRIFGYRFVAFASIAIAVIGFLVWGHHMFVSGQSVYAGMTFLLLSFLVAIPSSIVTAQPGSDHTGLSSFRRSGEMLPPHASSKASSEACGVRRALSMTLPMSP